MAKVKTLSILDPEYEVGTVLLMVPWIHQLSRRRLQTMLSSVLWYSYTRCLAFGFALSGHIHDHLLYQSLGELHVC